MLGPPGLLFLLLSLASCLSRRLLARCSSSCSRSLLLSSSTRWRALILWERLIGAPSSHWGHSHTFSFSFFSDSGGGASRPPRTHLQLRQRRHHVLPVAPEGGAGVPHQEELRQVEVAPQAPHAAQAAHKVDRQVQLLQALAAWRPERRGLGLGLAS